MMVSSRSSHGMIRLLQMNTAKRWTGAVTRCVDPAAASLRIINTSLPGIPIANTMDESLVLT